MLESGDSRNACAICQACSRKSFGNERTTSATARAREASLLRVSRIVGGVDVIDLPRTDAVDLDHRPVVKPGGVFHPSGPEAIRPRRQSFHSAAVEIITHSQEHGPGNYRDSFRFGCV